MKRYLLVKLVPGADAVTLQGELQKRLSKLDDKVDWLTHPVVFRSCTSESDVDIMAIFDLDGDDMLEKLKQHPKYMKLMDVLTPQAESILVFDHY